MKIKLRPVLLAAVLLTALASGHRGKPASPMIRVPDGQALFLSARAEGVQIYESKAKAADPSQFEWTLKGPEANLFDGGGRKIGKHYAGPTWEAADGSMVVGKRKSSADAPRRGDIAWLLLEASSTTGSGTMTGVSYVMRVDTNGGTAPEKAPTKLGQQARVKYRATYLFFAPAN